MTDNELTGETTPVSVQAGLDRLCEELHRAVGEQLVAVVLYGGVVEGEYSPGSSDVNVMVVLKNVSVETLDRIASSVQVGVRRFRLSAMVLGEEDLRRSTDVFPIKFLQMQRRHRILYGKDVLAELSVSRGHLRLRCEQEIRNLMLRLRQFYLRREKYAEQLEHTLNRAVGPFMLAVSTLIELKTGNAPSSKDAAVESAGQLGLNMEPVRKILAMKRGQTRLTAEELKQLYGAFMEVVHDAAGLADAL
jgi:predicted nucleotidyltransferase